jgi:putative flippase GtrA
MHRGQHKKSITLLYIVSVYFSVTVNENCCSLLYYPILLSYIFNSLKITNLGKMQLEIRKLIHFSFDLNTIIKFCTVGLLMAVANTTLLFFFVTIIKLYYLYAAIISYLLLLFFSYILNDIWTFKFIKTPRFNTWWKRLTIYYCVAFSGMGLNTFFLFIFTEYFKIFYIISSFIAIGLVFSWNFFINKSVTWRHAP